MKILEIFFWIWQLPQHIVALLYMFMLRITKGIEYNESSVFVKRPETLPSYIKMIRKKQSGSVSLGNYIFVARYTSKNTPLHEAGHSVQSRILGPLYLIVIGLPSIIWASVYKKFVKTQNDYYKFYTEKWADKIYNISRCETISCNISKI